MASHRPLYHRFAWAFDLVVPDASAGRVRRMAALLRARGVRPPARILDAGCGTGNYARALVRLGYHVVGVDRSPALLTAARARSAPAKRAREAGHPAFVRPHPRTFRTAAPVPHPVSRRGLNDVLHGRA